MDRDTRTRLFIDVGTNCEIVLSNGDQIVSTAAPAGPAFEGGAIRCGMRADDGAIEVVKLDPAGEVTLGVIGDIAPKGLCGSGLVDIVAELVKVGAASTRAAGSSTDEVAKEIAPGLRRAAHDAHLRPRRGARLRAAPADPRRRPRRLRRADPA